MHLNLAWIGHKLGAAMDHSQWLIWPLIAGCCVLGVIAFFSPNRFRAIATNGARWVDTSKFVQKLDTPVNIDQAVFRYSRVFGVAVVAASLFLAYLLLQRFAGGVAFGF